jgi:hypothetical protein
MSQRASHKPIEQMTADDLTEAMADPWWRLSNLYWIKTKEPEGSEDGDGSDDETLVVKFRPNRHQLRLLKRLHTRNIILKARQMGFSTLIQIYFLDCALFSNNINCGVIAHTDDAAKKLFAKIKFAYDRLPAFIKQSRPIVACNVSELKLGNGSTITVSTSMRGDTIHYLHVSEFGKICAKFPHRAVEVVTGTLPAVPIGGIVFIESTSEGREGQFYRMSTLAQANHDKGKKLTAKEYRFHFFPWHDVDEYQMPADGVIITAADHQYFDKIEGLIGEAISLEQRAWWVSTRDNDFSGEDSHMWQEYPSTPEEAFQQSTEGCYYSVQIAAARKASRFHATIPLLPAIPCLAFFDIGSSDGTAIWVVQRLGSEYRCVRFYEAWGEPYSHAAAWLQSLGVVWDTLWMPHDAKHVKQGETVNKSPQAMMQDLMPGVRIEIVPCIDDVNWGIQQTRDFFPLLHFDETECKEGLAHIESYRKKWNTGQQVWSSVPDKAGGHSEAADALRQLAQAYTAGILNVSRGPSLTALRQKKSSWRRA